MQEGGIPAYAGMTGGGNDVMGGLVRRWTQDGGIPAYAGMTGWGRE